MNTPLYKIAKLLITLQEISNIHIFRIEQRLYGRQAISQEVSPLIASPDINFKSLFSEKVASHVLTKHWAKVANEEKFKTLLLGEREVNIILTQLAKITRQQYSRNVNPLFVLYPKLLAEIGEEATNRDVKGMKHPRTLSNYKKGLYALLQHLPMYGEMRLNDYRTITLALKNWDKFSLPIIQTKI